MSIPDNIRLEMKARLYEQADKLNWMNLPMSERSRWYEAWTRDSYIGGILRHYMDPARVRVYIKDTLLKGYTHDRISDDARPMRVLGLPSSTVVADSYTKPNGRRLEDGRIFCWGRADDWKLVLMAVWERAYMEQDGRPYAAVLMRPTGRRFENSVRGMVEKAAQRLGVERVIWLDA